MKHLTIVRHAKSSWKDASLDDAERPLNQRGLRDAPRVGRYLDAHGGAPDLLASSPAVRAHTTARLLARALGYRDDRIQVVDALYLASASALADFVAGLDDDLGAVLLVGHNPGVSDFVERATGDPIDLPTCAVASLWFPVAHWAATLHHRARLAALVTPKTLPDAGE